MSRKIDLNSDVGESFGTYKLGLDEEVIPLITSSNIACGWHAGDPGVMRRTIALSKRHGVAPGAHPGFPDLLGFGRRNMDATLEEIEDYVTYQIGALSAFASQQGVSLQHVKPHGGLYNMAAKDLRIVEAVVKVISRLNRDLLLVTLAGPHRKEIEEIGSRHGVRIAFEFFADRGYNADGTLVSRREPGAVIHDNEVAAERVLKMVREGKVISRDGAEIVLSADTICVHGDNPSAVSLTRTIRQALLQAGITVAPMRTVL
ncbi:MAG: 5-oxoprolinase subunit PxpA [Desulfobacteraceae bacterium]|nr:MAG: 5-oxoprolinase subunit PxpA [Desulfobacteraceae bacterium]